ncbi:MAG: putative Ig domain-containing protein [Methylococcales bacterium]
MKILIRFFFLAFVGNFAQAAENCDDTYYVDVTLQNGSRWDMCWEHRSREGIVFHHIYYTPKNGGRKMILNQASVAQIHVPYDDNGARYHDVSDYGIGGSFLYNLKQSECPGGQLLTHSSKKVICRQIENRPFAYRHGTGGSKGQALSLFSVSHVGAYNYIPQWRFFDDGKIEPWMGATGALQRFGSNNVANRGWKMGDGRIGLAHLHNFYWRLDFDLGGTSNDDFVEEINFIRSSGKRERTTTKFSDETAREVNPTTMRSWRIVDGNIENSKGHAASYEILLNETGFKDKGPSSEAFTHNDFFVTKQRACEIFASHNPTTGGCGKNLDQFVNGESINNQDIVVWAGVTFYHMPRSEDAPHMDAHWNHFQVVPRDWHGVNPLSGGATNTAPQITQPISQNSREGDSIQLTIQASDADEDSLTYSASGLPTGLSINSNSGLISGVLASGSVGTYNVSVSVSDGQASDGATISWIVTAVASNQPPEVMSVVDQSNQEGDTPNLGIDATDPDGDVLSYSASGLPGGLSIDGSSGLISGTLSNSSAGTHSVTVTVSDGQVSRNTSFDWVITVVPVNNPPQITNPGDQNNQVGEIANISIEASDPDGDSLSFSAIGLPAGINIETTTGKIIGAITNSAVGNHSVTVSVFDGRFSRDTTFSWGIAAVSANQPPQVTNLGNQNNHPGESVNLNVQASDPDGDELTYTARSLPSGLSISSSTGVIFGTLATDSTGNYNVTVSASDGQATGTASFDWTVTEISAGPVFSDNFETDHGWQVNPSDSDSAATGKWERAIPEATDYNGTALQLGDPVSGQFNLVTGHRAGGNIGADDIDSGTTSMQSPAISLLADTRYELTLSYYFAHLWNATDVDFLRITVNGSGGQSQVILEQRGNGATKAASWQSLSVDISDFSGDTIHLLVEAADAGGGSLVEAAIDDVVITGSQGGGGSQGSNQSISSQVATSSDDAEEKDTSGNVTTTNGDLDLTASQGDTQTTGIRFLPDIPAGVTIVNAYIQFTADEARSSATSLIIKGQSSGNALTFTSANGDISGRATTGNSVNWNSVPSWSNIGDAGSAQRTPDLSSIIQEIIDDPNWSGGNGLAIIITGSGKRPAETYDADPTKAAVLHVEYSTGSSGGNQNPIAVNDNATVQQDAVVNGNVLDGSLSGGTADSDRNGDSIQVDSNTMPSNGTLTTGVTSNGLFTYAPNTGYTGSDSFDYTISDGQGGTAMATVSVQVMAGGIQLISSQVASSSDDAEEKDTSGNVTTTNSDLDLTASQGDTQTTGIRFLLDVPPSAIIVNAYIQFTADETRSVATSLTIKGESSSNAPTFISANRNISARATTGSSVVWSSVPSWDNIGDAGSAQRTPDLSAIIQEIVNGSGWSSGNGVAIIITGTGKRPAETYDADPAKAAVLRVEYQT